MFNAIYSPSIILQVPHDEIPPSQLSRPRPINEEILRYDLDPEEEPDQYMGDGEVTEDWYPIPQYR